MFPRRIKKQNQKIKEKQCNKPKKRNGSADWKEKRHHKRPFPGGVYPRKDSWGEASGREKETRSLWQ